MKTDKFVEMIVAVADESKGEAITWIDISNPNFLVQKVVVVTAMNNVHMRALGDTIAVRSKELIRAAGDDSELGEPIVSGTAESGWVILDFGSLAIHVLTQELREYYELDKFFEKQGIVFHFE